MNQIEYGLYKEPISSDTLYIVQYLYSNGIVLIPTYIIERNHKHHGITELPAIVCDDTIYSGIMEVTKFYEQISGITNLLNKAREWKIKNPNYRINDQ
jgi:hypothetical protein